MTTDNKNKPLKCNAVTLTTDTIPLLWQLKCFFFFSWRPLHFEKAVSLYTLKTFCKLQLKLQLLLGLQVQTPQLSRIWQVTLKKTPGFLKMQSLGFCVCLVVCLEVCCFFFFNVLQHNCSFQKGKPSV